MNSRFKKRLQALSTSGGAELIAGGWRGIEKESLRIEPSGYIAQTGHQQALGSALTNRYITTDYSEALLEFVTPPENSAWAAIQFLCDIHQYVYQTIGDELLWPFSMPCRLRSEDDIPLALYGTSNIAQMKTIYRSGLGYRYGKYMQVISGIHFNYSVPENFWPAWAGIEESDKSDSELRSDSYLGLVRNVRRLDWLLMYLFGASPAVCKSFLAGQENNLSEFDSGTCYGEWATSLRMSDLGYQNTNQSALVVSANSLDEYVLDLSAAIRTPNPDYVKIGIKDNGEYLQLNANLLQIENEYYSTIRPKRVARSGERPTAALRRGGIQYVELRALDLSPFDPVGIGQQQQKFLEAFLLYCLLVDSPPIGSNEQQVMRANQLAVAREGRKPGLELHRADAEIRLQDWAGDICTQMQPVCEMLDEGEDTGYLDALQAQQAAIDDPDLTPSARLLSDLRDVDIPFADYGLGVARDYRDYFLGLGDEFNQHRELFEKESIESLQRQQQLEAQDDVDLDAFLQRYYA
ncbi:MAG: glutamate--cysteine ligase [Gammaproteobacteria bacterium]|nr:glutamate--cysteine ligase [Gammaproteobacteria bacterium]MDP6617641.1 glutamate--cysteine ligase [Gammaproteobacteria bacterium]MDP6694518.1 glutamate--cysteine ligase [Gammaproteobacteria bacterium]